MAISMDRAELVRLARLGAEARLVALERERAEILRTFPELRNGSAMRAAAPRRRRAGQMSPAARKAVSIRMKKYWAARRKAQAKNA